MPEYQFIDITNTNILKRFLTGDCKTVESSDAPLSSVKTSLSDLKFQLSLIKFSKFFANRVLPFLFRCNFVIPSWFSFKFSLSINPILFCVQKFLFARFFQIISVFSNNNIRKRYCRVSGFVLVLLTIF